MSVTAPTALTLTTMTRAGACAWAHDASPDADLDHCLHWLISNAKGIIGPVPANPPATPPTSPPDELDLDSQLRIAVGRLNRRIRAEMADGDLSDGQFSVLALLFRVGPRAVGELAEAYHDGRLTDQPNWHNVNWMKERTLG